MSQKPMQLGSPDLTQKCSVMSPGNPYILGSDVAGRKNTASVALLHSCECWFPLVLYCNQYLFSTQHWL